MSGNAIPPKNCEAIPAFRGCNPSECQQLVDIAQEKSFAPGQKIIEQGKTSQYLWILLEGRCDVVKDSQHDGRVTLAQLEPYQLFGEMSFFSPAPHSATVVARTPVKLLSIARADYDDLIRDGVGAAYKLAYNVVGSVAARLRRMDEWITELAGDHDEHANGSPARPEWRTFRDKLFNEWNL